MDYSAANSALWNILIQFGILAAAIIVANILRRKITFFRKSLMPTAVLAGFLLLILRSVGVLHLDNTLLEMTTYHGIAVGFMLPPSQIEDENEEYINKEQADADVMVISPENKKPREEEERRRNLVIDDADIVMSPQSNKSHSKKNKPKTPVRDDDDFVFSTPENSKKHKK